MSVFVCSVVPIALCYVDMPGSAQSYVIANKMCTHKSFFSCPRLLSPPLSLLSRYKPFVHQTVDTDDDVIAKSFCTENYYNYKNVHTYIDTHQTVASKK